LTREQALALYAMGPEAVVLVSLALARRVAQMQPSAVSPATPSAAVPVHLKPKTARTRRKKPGAKVGHVGSRRPTPTKIDARVEHRLPACPCCGGELQRCRRTRTRIVEDIPQDIQPIVTEHTIHRDYCKHCKKHVEQVVPDALPNATLGHNVVALSSYFHYGLGLSIEQTRQILGSTLNTPVTAGGLMSSWSRMAEALRPWHEQIADELRTTACLHADETGWRVDGSTHWLWCFCDTRTCLYLIDRSRGGPALARFFTDAFAGTLVTDFWSAYHRAGTTGSRPAVLPGPPAERAGKGGRSQRQRGLAGLRQAAASTGARRHPIAEAAGLQSREVRFADSADQPPAEQAGRRRGGRRVRRRRRPSAWRADQQAPGPPVHVFGQDGGAV